MAGYNGNFSSICRHGSMEMCISMSRSIRWRIHHNISVDGIQCCMDDPEDYVHIATIHNAK